MKLGWKTVNDLENILVKVNSTKYLTKKNFLEAKKMTTVIILIMVIIWQWKYQ